MCGLWFLQGQAQGLNAPSGVQPPAPADSPPLAQRIAQAFGQAASKLLADNTSTPPAPAPFQDVLLVGTAVESPTGPSRGPQAQPLQLPSAAPPAVPPPAAALAPSTTMTAEVAAAASLAAPGRQGQQPPELPKPPLHELVDAAAEIPARLGILPALPGMPGQQQSSTAAQLQSSTMFTIPADQGGSVVPAQRGSVPSGMSPSSSGQPRIKQLLR